MRSISLIKGGSQTQEITNARFNKYMGTVVGCTLDPDALDNSQCFLMDCIDDGTNWRLFYVGANTVAVVYAPDGLTYDNVDQVFLAIKTKSNDVRTGWNKFLDVNGDPKPVFQPSFVNGQFDKAQVWIRSMLYEGGVLKAWFVGDDGTPTFVYRVGYATSNDFGETWTKSGTTPIYTDAGTSSRGIVMLRVTKNGSTYVMIYCHIDPNVSGFQIAESSDGLSWAKTQTNILANQNYGWICDFKYTGGFYYFWVQKNFQTGSNFGPARDIYLLRSTNLTDWTSLGPQLTIRPANEFGIGNMSKILQKPNGSYFMLHTYYTGRIQALAGITAEPSQSIKVAESSAEIQNSACSFEYPDYVTFHAPLGNEMGFAEVIAGGVGTINSLPSYAELEFIRLSGSQTLTFSNSGSVISGEHFGVKMRVQVLTTGTHELFRIGDDIIMSLESGKLRVRLSSDGLGYEKDYITTVNISKPTGLDYIDDHIYVGFIWGPSSNLRLFNDFVEFTSGQITETVDDALATVNNSSSNILIGQNATLELRSVSVLLEPTETEFKELDI